MSWRQLGLEDNRITCLKQVILLVFVLGMLACGSTAVHADSTGTGSINIVPGTGSARGIQLRSQTVDLVIKEDASGAWADTDLRVQLHNRGATQVVMLIGVPGPQVSETDLSEITEATLDGRPLTLTRVDVANRPEVRATATITVPVQGTVDIRIRYRQALATQDELVSYAYLLTASHVWAGVPESLRVSISFAQPVSPDQLLHLAPAPRSPSPGILTWEWSGVKAPSNIGLAFMSSGWWRQLEEERSAAAEPEAGLREHIALGERYWHAATLAPPVFAPRASFYERFSSQAIAEWRVGIAAARADSDPVELAAARERLAGLYLAEASRESTAASQTYLQLAVDELVQATALDPGDTELGTSARALQRLLAAATRAHEGKVPEDAPDAAPEQLYTSLTAHDAGERAQVEGLVLAQRAVEAGDFADARRILTSTLGAGILDLPEARPPRISQALLNVSNAPGRRAVRLQLMDNEQGAAASRLISEADKTLRGLSGVVSNGTVLTLTLTYHDPSDVLSWQDRLNAALPDLPELALLSSALSTRHLAWPIDEDILTRTYGYQERVDLSKGIQAWEREAARLDQAADQAESSGQPLDLLRAAIWRDDARSWRNIGLHSRAIYSAEVSGTDSGPSWLLDLVHRRYREGRSQRQWMVEAGEVRQLEASVLAWRYDRLVLMLAATLLLALLTSLAVRSFSRTPAESVAAGAADTAAP